MTDPNAPVLPLSFAELSPCERQQLALSALVDGEASSDEAIEAIDHLVGCPSCADFYRRLRALGEAVLAASVPSPAGPPPEAGWQRVVAALEAGPERRGAGTDRPRRSRTLRWLPVAALLLVSAGVGLLLRRGVGEEPATAPAEGAIEVELGGSPEAMTDARFVALTTELLQSDLRYQRKMLEVMTQVSRALGPSEEGGEDSAAPLAPESRFQIGSGEEPGDRLRVGRES